jgi:GntR family transcriptional regulator/MocR family aminotransferase
VLFPGLRLAYLVVPEPLVELFVNARVVAGRQSPTLEQALVERFMTDGHMARHILRMRKLYAERREALIDVFGRTLGDLIRLQPCDTGLQMLGWLEEGWSDRDICQDASAVGLEVSPLSRFAISRRLPPALLLGFGAFGTREIMQGAEQLARVLRRYATRARPRGRRMAG